jgi:hypothetical protein
MFQALANEAASSIQDCVLPVEQLSYMAAATTALS